MSPVIEDAFFSFLTQSKTIMNFSHSHRQRGKGMHGRGPHRLSLQLNTEMREDATQK